MTLDDLANYKGEWVTPASTTYHDQFTVYGHAGAVAGVGHRRSAERARACVPTWYPGQTLAIARTGQPAVLARAHRDEEGRLRATSTATTPIRTP